MKQKKALVKLAQVRLAINHVLRQRMVKKATSGAENPTIPYWIGNPYNDGREFKGEITSPEGITSTRYFRNQGDLDSYMTSPDIPMRYGSRSDLYKPTIRDKIGPLWNAGLNMWNRYRFKPYDNWASRRSDFMNTPEMVDLLDKWNSTEFNKRLNEWDKRNPGPPEPSPMPDQLYMRDPLNNKY